MQGWERRSLLRSIVWTRIPFDFISASRTLVRLVGLLELSIFTSPNLKFLHLLRISIHIEGRGLVSEKNNLCKAVKSLKFNGQRSNVTTIPTHELYSSFVNLFVHSLTIAVVGSLSLNIPGGDRIPVGSVLLGFRNSGDRNTWSAKVRGRLRSPSGWPPPSLLPLKSHPFEIAPSL